jgi:hypothetical protein
VESGIALPRFCIFLRLAQGASLISLQQIHFIAVFLGSFFICFAYLQFLSAFNIERYAFNVGCLIIGRAFYVIQLYAYMGFVSDFPSTFWFTGIIDGLFIVLYIAFAFRGGLSLRDLFLPKKQLG